MNDPVVTQQIRDRTKAAMNRYHRRKRARENALIEEWLSNLPPLNQCQHAETRLVTISSDELANGTVIDPMVEQRCANRACNALVGLSL